LEISAEKDPDNYLGLFLIFKLGFHPLGNLGAELKVRAIESKGH